MVYLNSSEIVLVILVMAGGGRLDVYKRAVRAGSNTSASYNLAGPMRGIEVESE